MSLADQFNTQTTLQKFGKLPLRIFLDTNVVQYLSDFGSFIFEGVNILFDDTQLFNSGELDIKEFDIPDAELILYEHFYQRGRSR